MWPFALAVAIGTVAWVIMVAMFVAMTTTTVVMRHNTRTQEQGHTCQQQYRTVFHAISLLISDGKNGIHCAAHGRNHNHN